jgi:hypothetical protein
MSAIQGLQGGSSNAQAVAEARRSANVRAQPPREEFRTEAEPETEAANRLNTGRNEDFAEENLHKRETEHETELRAPLPSQGRAIDFMA